MRMANRGRADLVSRRHSVPGLDDVADLHSGQFLQTPSIAFAEGASRTPSADAA